MISDPINPFTVCDQVAARTGFIMEKRNMSTPKFIRLGPKRPIDKVTFSFTRLNTLLSQINVVVRDADMAETLAGGNINWSSVGIATQFMAQCLMVIPEGISTPVMNISTDAAFIVPEEFVIWSRIFAYRITAGAVAAYAGSDRIKTQRKLKKGDRVILSTLQDTNDATQIAAIVTLFFKQ